MLKIGWNNCPYCGDREVYRSRSEALTWLDRVCVLFLLQLVRCHQCELRHYRPIFFRAPEYAHPIRDCDIHTHTQAEGEEHERSA
jgi:hypothetical protein